MKKRFLPIIMAALMLMALIPLGIVALADDGEYTAWFGAQMDPVDGWNLGDISMTTFNIGEPATIAIDFGETVSFGDGNYIAIETDLPNPFGGETIFTDPGIAQVLSFKLDGEDVAFGAALINAEGKPALDESGPGLRITLTNKWNGDILAQPVDPVLLGEFTTLEVVFIVHGLERTEYTAQFGAQMDPVDGWSLGDVAATTFTIGEPATIEIDFGETVSFGDGNYIAIETNIPNPYADVTIFRDPNSAQVLSFKLDGEEVDIGDVYINAEGMDAIDESGAGLRLTLANKWNGDVAEQPVDPLELGEFNTLEVEFIVYGMGMPPEPEEPGEVPDGGIAWIGGTFTFSEGHPANADDPGICDWWDFPEQATEFEFGVPFTVTLDMGSETVTYDVAHWDGHIICVDSDFGADPSFVAAYIDSIKVDGAEISFDQGNMEVGVERGGIRVTLNSGWTETPVAQFNAFGTFSKLEVTLALVDIDADNPFGGGPASTPEPVDNNPPPPVVIDPTVNNDTGSDSGGLSTGVLIAIICGGVAVVAVVVVLVVKGKKK